MSQNQQFYLHVFISVVVEPIRSVVAQASFDKLRAGLACVSSGVSPILYTVSNNLIQDAAVSENLRKRNQSNNFYRSIISLVAWKICCLKMGQDACATSWQMSQNTLYCGQ
jgi:hypothetical protein